MRPLAFLLVFLLFAPAQAQGEGKWGKIWKVSLAIVATASFVDAGSSLGRRESNGFLASPNGRFGYKGLAIKGGVAGGLIAAQLSTRRIMVKKNREREELDKFISVTNLVWAGIFTGAAIHNYRISGRIGGKQ